ncbi:MAG: AMP-binding protein, partial [Gammaproteobacteria bacterium]|nr:AMP-binding protein [Gammaproteobacteria bacterium]
KLLAGIDDYDLSSLRQCVSAGEHLPLPTFEDWYAATGIKLIDGFGATEMIHVFVTSAGDDIRPGATGRAAPGYRVAVLGDDGRALPAGEPGRLAVKGPTGCRYLDDNRQRDYVLGGWNITGDICRLDDAGYVWYLGRGDDMIISAGYNISGPEVEAALLPHPAVSECAVVGAGDAERGTIVKAFVVLSEGSQASEELTAELKEFVKQRIAPYKYPRAIQFVDALPLTKTGKIQRFKLRT